MAPNKSVESLSLHELAGLDREVRRAMIRRGHDTSMPPNEAELKADAKLAASLQRKFRKYGCSC